MTPASSAPGYTGWRRPARTGLQITGVGGKTCRRDRAIMDYIRDTIQPPCAVEGARPNNEAAWERRSAHSPLLSMASSSGSGDENTDGASWRLVGPASELSARPCCLMYSPLGHKSDVCLFHVKGEFFAMDARCSHSGGPLCDGDIEDANGVLKVFCPWHDYDFNLKTGKSGTGLQQEVYEVKLQDNCVYVKHASPLSLKPFPAVK